ncbi:phosphate ABC transporter permease subunit PstC [Dictyobacter kobayashii]|uniref:Phosphate transport system permease protein n=1 Tax=Dictyobacter kobayashii TaxID=2014872 RepID=A0A402AJH5_9CHLR|nr:phosphate ABC transporter permease subunit PstC [Dictyobacter kobayashii]GCE19223.1 putative ABC transporter permease protein YqgH [Dictyobacter kobayashii]
MADTSFIGQQQRQIRNMRTRKSRTVDQGVRGLFFLCAALIVAIIFGIFFFIGLNAFRMFSADPHSSNFLSTTIWDPEGNLGAPSYGMLGFILGSIVTTMLAVVIATPLSFGMALFMTEVCPRWLENVLRPLLEIFTGMPSVVIGFLALVALVPIIRDIAGPLTPIPALAGYGWAAATVVLILMILPTIISISIDALRSIPTDIREASLALGSTRWQMMRRAILPAATTGLATAVILGMSRAIGEALAVSLVLKGKTLPVNVLTPAIFFQPNVNMTQPIVINFPEAVGAERDAYFMLGFLLLVVSFLFICLSRYIASRSVYK